MKHNIVKFKKGRSLNDEDLVTAIILSGKNYCSYIHTYIHTYINFIKVSRYLAKS